MKFSLSLVRSYLISSVAKRFHCRRSFRTSLQCMFSVICIITVHLNLLLGKTWFLLLTRFLMITYLTTLSLTKEFFCFEKVEEKYWTDLSHITVSKGTNLRVGWTKCSNSCKITSIHLIVCSLERNVGRVYFISKSL